MDYTSVINSLFIIFVLSIPGVVFRKLKMIDEKQIKPVSSFMMKVILPAVIIYSMQTDFSKDMLIAGGKVFGSIFVLFLCVFIFSAILSVVTKNGKKYIGIITFLLFFANTGGIGIQKWLWILFCLLLVFCLCSLLESQLEENME